MIYSYTQLSHFLACPRRYRYRYVDGWRERDSRPGLLFGRAFENALMALFRHEDAGSVFFEHWSQQQNARLEYSRGDTWQSMYQQGQKLLDLFAQHDRVAVPCPKRNLQVRVSKRLSPTSEFVGYIDAYGFLDGTRCVIDWKTTAARYPQEPEGVLALDPQLVCYSWLTGEPEVAFVVFVRKRMPEIQYLRATITKEQRHEFELLVQDMAVQIELGQFLAHPGIRFPQNTCTSCSYVGLCLKNEVVSDRLLVHGVGGELAWLDELEY